MFCSSCGNALAPESAFCSNCGRPVSATSAPQPSADQAPVSVPTAQPTGPVMPAPAAPSYSYAGPAAATQFAPPPADGFAYAPASPPTAGVGLRLRAGFTPEVARATLSTLWRPFAVAFGVALAVIGVAMLLATTDELGGVTHWLQFSLLTLALAVRGHARGTAGEADWSLVAIPTSLTAIMLGLLLWESRRAERKAPTGPAWPATATLSVATGFGCALVLALVTAFNQIPLETNATEDVTSVSASFWWTLLWGTLLMGAAIATGRFSARVTVDDEHGSAVASQVREKWRVWRSAVRGLGSQLLVGGVLALVVGFVLLLRPVDGARDTASSLVAALLFLPTVALGGLALAMGASLSIGIGILTGLSVSIGLLTGKLGFWYYSAVLIPLAATLVAGVREGVRQPRGARWPSTTWWRLPVLSVATWLCVGFLTWFSAATELAQVSFGATKSTYSMHLGLVLLPVLAALWGLLLLVCQVCVTERFASMFPRLTMRLGGKSVDPMWRESIGALLVGATVAPPAPAWHGQTTEGSAGEGPAWPDHAGGPTPPGQDTHGPETPLRDRRRAGKVVALVTAVALVIVAALGVGVSIAAHALGSPTKTVQEALQAINAGDVDYLEAHTASWPTSPLTTSAALKATHTGARALTDITTDESGSGDTRQVAATWRVNGVSQQRSFTVSKTDDKRYGVIHQWRVSGLTATLSATSSATSSLGGSFSVTGVEQSLTGPVTAAPGAYEVSVPTSGGLIATPQTVVVGPGGYGQARVNVTVSEETRTQVLTAVDNLFARCVATNMPSPPNCPFSVYAYAPTNFRWSMPTKPSTAATVSLRSYDGAIVVSGPMNVSATYDQQSFFGGDPSKTETVTGQYSLKATFTGDAVTLTRTF